MAVGSTASRIAVVCCLALHTVEARAQSYDPGTGSPMSLLIAPKDGVAYYDLRKRAARLAFENAAEAEPLVEQLVRDYPRDAENWRLLGVVKRGMNKPAEAAVAFEKAEDMGARRDPMLPASSYVAAGDNAAALAVVRRGIFDDRSIYRQQLFGAQALAPCAGSPSSAPSRAAPIRLEYPAKKGGAAISTTSTPRRFASVLTTGTAMRPRHSLAPIRS